MVNKFLLVTLSSFWIPVAAIQAQDPQGQNEHLQNKGELQKNVEILVGVLEDSLGLKNDTGLLGIFSGGVDSTYLLGQGVLLEIRTPLSRDVSRLGLTDISGKLQELSNRSVPRPPMPPVPQIMALNINKDAFSSLYAEMVEKWTELEVSSSVSEASSRAANAARSLRSLGELDQESYEVFQTEMERMRGEIDSQLDQFRHLQEQWKADIQNQSASTRQDDSAALTDKLNALLERVAPLRDEAIKQAEELNARFIEAKQQDVLQWNEEVSELEANLYATMCNYGAAVKALPNNENISVILQDLGSDVAQNAKADKIHVLSKADLLACQSGAIDVSELIARSSQYAY